MSSKVDAKYVRDVEDIFETLIRKIEGTKLVSDSGQVLLHSLQRNVAANYHKKEKQS